MAIRITRIDDIDGTDGAELFSLELDNASYEIDLCPRNRARLLRAIRPFIERARPIHAEVEVGNRSAGPSAARDDRQEDDRTMASWDRGISNSSHLDLSEMAREVRD